MPDWIEDDHLVQSNQGWVELPDCATAADASRPLLTGDQQKDGLSHVNSAATCKPGTHWANTPDLGAARPLAPAKASGLGATRPF